MRGKLAAWRRNKNNRKWGVLGAVLILLIAIVLLFRTLGGAATGTIDNSANSALNPPAAAPNPIKTQGKYVAFTYPDNFRAVPTEKPSGNELESFDYVTKHSPFWELAIGVSSLPSGNLADNASYNMRSQNSGRYTLEHWTIGGASVPVFSDEKESYSKVAFVAHSGKLLTMALSGSGDSQKLQAAETDVLKSLSWKD